MAIENQLTEWDLPRDYMETAERVIHHLTTLDPLHYFKDGLDILIRVREAAKVQMELQGHTPDFIEAQELENPGHWYTELSELATIYYDQENDRIMRDGKFAFYREDFHNSMFKRDANPIARTIASYVAGKTELEHVAVTIRDHIVNKITASMTAHLLRRPDDNRVDKVFADELPYFAPSKGEWMAVFPSIVAKGLLSSVADKYLPNWRELLVEALLIDPNPHTLSGVLEKNPSSVEWSTELLSLAEQKALHLSPEGRTALHRLLGRPILVTADQFAEQTEWHYIGESIMWGELSVEDAEFELVADEETLYGWLDEHPVDIPTAALGLIHGTGSLEELPIIGPLRIDDYDNLVYRRGDLTLSDLSNLVYVMRHFKKGMTLYLEVTPANDEVSTLIRAAEADVREFLFKAKDALGLEHFKPEMFNIKCWPGSIPSTDILRPL